MNKHTPGPWFSQKPKWLDPTKTRHIYDKDGHLIARVDYANRAQSENEAIANAELIAAAPELFETLEQVTEVINWLVYDGDCTPLTYKGASMPDMINRAKAIISKVKEGGK